MIDVDNGVLGDAQPASVVDGGEEDNDDELIAELFSSFLPLLSFGFGPIFFC
jgi:hypothetical protein